MKIGAQMYTLRDFCKTLEGLDESLGRVAEIGYRSVQLSGVCPYDAAWMAERLKAYGLTCDLTHYDVNKILHETDQTIKHHDRLGCRYIGLGYSQELQSEESFSRFVANLGEPIKKIAASGHKFMYHNHNHEFAKRDGKVLLYHLCDAFAKEELGITLDCYWAQAGGADSVALLRNLSGRVECVHYKDMVYSLDDKAPRMTAVGQGNMNYEAIIRASYDAGVEFAFVEQDNCYGEDPFVCLKQSYDYLKAQGLS